jgi:hypothetical protein
VRTERRHQHTRTDVFSRATEVIGADVPAHRRMLTIEQPARRTGLVIFSGVFWFVAGAAAFDDPRPGALVALLAAAAVNAAAAG